MALVKQFVFGVDPENGLNNTYSWTGLASNNNSDGKAITCAYIPKTRGNDVNVSSGEMLIAGLDLGKIWRTFIEGETMDDGSTLTAEAITNNISPSLAAGRDIGMVRVVKAEFPRINPLNCAGVTVFFSVDTDKPEIFGANWTELDYITGADIASLASALGKSFNLRIVDTGCGATVFDGFSLHYYEIGPRNRESS